MLWFCKKKSDNKKLEFVLKLEVSTFKMHRSFYSDVFLHYTRDNEVKTLFFSKRNEKIEAFCLQQSLKTYCMISFLSVYWILNIRRKCHDFFNFLYSIKWRKEIIQQIFENHCKDTASIFKLIVDSVTKKYSCIFTFGKKSIFTHLPAAYCKSSLE